MEEFEEIADVLVKRFEQINTKYIELISKHINSIGKLNPTDIHILEQMNRMGRNVEQINKLLMRQTGLMLDELYKVYDESSLSQYEDAKAYYKYNNTPQVPFKDNYRLQNYINAYKLQTATKFYNLANSTVLSMDYTELLDMAITERTSGLITMEQAKKGIVEGRQARLISKLNSRYGSYNFTDKTIKQLLTKARDGLKVTYKSGRTRRLDSAVRMNLVDGLGQFANRSKEIIGRDFGADGVEVDAHGLCAKDHQHIQGKQYTLAKFEDVQDNLKRKISTCNCQHSINYIILGINKPTYTNKQIKEMNDWSNAKFEINGSKFSRYEISQKMREMETRVRYLKDDIMVLRNFDGTDGAIRDKMDKIKFIKNTYKNTADVAGLTYRLNRMVVPGF